ncbi:MAG: lysophospholipid acyltransferase family protein [Chitinivibrionales bacterium]|nr:lysophospholipid acyltransferase family protein [Chitinivibrionales bacterium]
MILEKIIQRCFFKAGYLFFRLLCKGKIIGSENVAACLPSGFVLVANHGSHLDSIVIWSYLHAKFGVDIIFFAKEKLFKNPLFGPCMRAASCVKVSNDSNAILDFKAYRNMVGRKFIGVFPEGSRTGNGAINAYKYGASEIADKLNLPILPVALSGFYKAWPRGRFLPRPKKCELVFLPPVRAKGPGSLDQAMGRIKERQNDYNILHFSWLH